MEYLERAGQETRRVAWRAIIRLMKQEGPVGMIYIFLIAMLFYVFKVLGILFNSQQRKDIHHAIAFDIIAYKK